MVYQPMTVSTVRDIVDIVKNAMEMSAICIGGLWTYYHFVKGRVFRPRMTLSLKAHSASMLPSEYIVCSVQVSNIGLSQIRLSQADIAIWSINGIERARLGGATVLSNHGWVEPAAVLSEQIVIPCRIVKSPVLVDLRIVVRSKRWLRRAYRGVAYGTTAIVDCAQDSQKGA